MTESKDQCRHCLFCHAFECNLCRARARVKNRRSKLAAISVQFGRDLSARCRRGFENVRCNLAAIWDEIAANIAASLHLRQKLHWK